MSLPKQMCTFFALSTLIVAVEAIEPICKHTGEDKKQLVCSSGTENYILVKGLVSDSNTTTEITLRACRIIDIEYGSFKNLPSVWYIDVSRNKLHRLKRGVLDEATSLTFLNMSYNGIASIPLGLFDFVTKMEYLDLKGNHLNFLEIGTFDKLKKLKLLDLSSNRILGKDLNPYLLDENRHIYYIDFSRNDMTGTPSSLLNSFQELDMINLDRCSLTEVPEFATLPFDLKSMKHLMISTNLISKIDNAATFVNLDNLEILNLAENIIEYINENVLKPLKKLKMILLRNNKLKQIPDILFINIRFLEHVDLSSNALEFLANDTFRGTSLKILYLSSNKFTYLQRNFCTNIRDSGGRLTELYFQQNPWQCACLHDLLKEVKSLDIKYNTMRYTGDEPVCVTTNEFHCKREDTFNEIYINMYENMILNI